VLKSAIDEEAVRKTLEECEKEAKREAEKILKEYEAKAKKIKFVRSDLIEQAAELIRKEVLSHEL